MATSCKLAATDGWKANFKTHNFFLNGIVFVILQPIDGKQFDSSRGGVPLACRLCDLIEGWIVAVQQMHIGDKWELYIPSEMGYGKFSQPGIPGGSTLIFEIELLGIA